jgi:hypothetical protein
MMRSQQTSFRPFEHSFLVLQPWCKSPRYALVKLPFPSRDQKKQPSIKLFSCRYKTWICHFEIKVETIPEYQLV